MRSRLKTSLTVCGILWPLNKGCRFSPRVLQFLCTPVSPSKYARVIFLNMNVSIIFLLFAFQLSLHLVWEAGFLPVCPCRPSAASLPHLPTLLCDRSESAVQACCVSGAMSSPLCSCLAIRVMPAVRPASPGPPGTVGGSFLYTQQYLCDVWLGSNSDRVAIDLHICLLSPVDNIFLREGLLFWSSSQPSAQHGGGLAFRNCPIRGEQRAHKSQFQRDLPETFSVTSTIGMRVWSPKSSLLKRQH